MSDEDRRCVEAALPNLMSRPQGKRRVKPIPAHLLQLTFGMESDPDDDDTEYTCVGDVMDNSVSSPESNSQDELVIIDTSSPITPVPMKLDRKNPNALKVDRGKEPSALKANKKDPNVLKVDSRDPTVLKVERKDPTVLKVDRKDSTVLKADRKEPTLVKLDRKDPMVLKVGRRAPTAVKLDRKEPTVLKASRNKPTVLKVGRKEPTVVKGNRKEPTVLTVDRKQPTAEQKVPTVLKVNKKEPMVLMTTGRKAATVLEVRRENQTESNFYRKQPSVLDIEREEQTISKLFTKPTVSKLDEKQSAVLRLSRQESPLLNKDRNPHVVKLDTKEASPMKVDKKEQTVTKVNTNPIVQLSKVILNTDNAKSGGNKNKNSDKNKYSEDDDDDDVDDTTSDSSGSSSPNIRDLINEIDEDDDSSDGSFKPAEDEVDDVKLSAMSQLLGSESSDESFCGGDEENSDDESEEEQDPSGLNEVEEIQCVQEGENKEEGMANAVNESFEEEDSDDSDGGGDAMTIGQLIQCLKEKPRDEDGEQNEDKLYCSVCLCDDSNEDDGEIMQCDNCGVTIHEACCGQASNDADSESGKSNDSEFSTEPWFCDACRANCTPSCALCPTSSGDFKETYDGRWVHTVCALYTQDVEFGSVEKLSPIILSKIPEARWDSRLCDLCNKSVGVVIRCDAGMCKSHFHVTCAQKFGLLTEAPAHEMVADPFYANCRQHCNKDSASQKKKTYKKAMQSTAKFLEKREVEGQTQRVLSRLEQARRDYKPPTHSRTLAHLSATSMYYLKPTHVKKEDEFKEVKPSFTVEFVEYFNEREDYIKKSEDECDELQRIKDSLRREEKGLEEVIQKLEYRLDEIKEEGQQLWKAGMNLHEILNTLAKEDRPVPSVLARGAVIDIPVESEPPKERRSRPSRPHKEAKHPVEPAQDCHSCCVCKSSNDQELLIECDQCHSWYHLNCLDPPLKKMPPKSSRYAWHCHKCDKESDFFLQPNRVQDSSQTSSKHGRAIRLPEKFIPTDELPKKTPPQPGIKRKRVANGKSAGRKKGSGNQPPAKKDKKERDVRTECSKCSRPGDNYTLVRCDTCRKCYHFQCLDPPRKSSPRTSGYCWYCVDCIPMSCSEDESWEVLDRAEKMFRKLTEREGSLSDVGGDDDE
ncbi:PHD finger protein 14-like [Corticium candelabrum]|uniref:PHD finger protein 14-like n=1 Tax=Corticium candelabrum TaxID=121492 RepID=UPI002E25839E|nr:PHD finger protein 14-like [Corticium candelabrum]